MNRLTASIIALGIGAGLTWLFPLFHIVPLEQLAAAKTASFDAATFAPQFWAKTLVPSFELAHDATEVIAAIKENPAGARKSFGKSIGIGRVYFYFLRGEGVITAIEKQGVAISIVAPDNEADIVLKTGLLFGNAIRDATGQIPASDYANSQNFNAISKELNRIVQENVQPELKKHSQVGRKIRFIACTEMRTSSKKLLPLVMVPLKVDFPE
jgi:predicted lipoprotein